MPGPADSDEAARAAINPAVRHTLVRHLTRAADAMQADADRIRALADQASALTASTPDEAADQVAAFRAALDGLARSVFEQVAPTVEIQQAQQQVDRLRG